jgi:hypothetical protein
MTVVNGSASNGHASNGSEESYVRPDFLSDAVRGREIDGSEYWDSDIKRSFEADASSWIDEVRGTWGYLFRT